MSSSIWTIFLDPGSSLISEIVCSHPKGQKTETILCQHIYHRRMLAPSSGLGYQQPRMMAHFVLGNAP